jgi:hypothetical protein
MCIKKIIECRKYDKKIVFTVKGYYWMIKII